MNDGEGAENKRKGGDEAEENGKGMRGYRKDQQIK